MSKELEVRTKGIIRRKDSTSDLYIFPFDRYGASYDIIENNHKICPQLRISLVGLGISREEVGHLMYNGTGLGEPIWEKEIYPIINRILPKGINRGPYPPCHDFLTKYVYTKVYQTIQNSIGALIDKNERWLQKYTEELEKEISTGEKCVAELCKIKRRTKMMRSPCKKLFFDEIGGIENFIKKCIEPVPHDLERLINDLRDDGIKIDYIVHYFDRSEEKNEEFDTYYRPPIFAIDTLQLSNLNKYNRVVINGKEWKIH